MTEKQSTIFYHEWLDLFEDLTTEEVGAITLAVLKYEKNGENPMFSDRTVRAIWKTIKGTLDRNKQKYEEICQKRAAAGRKGGRPRKEETEEKSKNQKDNFAFQKKAKKADSDSECVRDSDNDHDNDHDSERGGECVREYEREELPAPPDTTTTTLQDQIVHSWNQHSFVQKIKRVDNPAKRWERTEMAIAVAGGPEEFLRVLNTLEQQAYLRHQPDDGYQVIYDWLIQPDTFQSLLEGKYEKDRTKNTDGLEVVTFDELRD